MDTGHNEMIWCVSSIVASCYRYWHEMCVRPVSVCLRVRVSVWRGRSRLTSSNNTRKRSARIRAPRAGFLPCNSERQPFLKKPHILQLSGSDWSSERRINSADKDVNKSSRCPAERGDLHLFFFFFWINHADSGFFWLNPKLSLGRGNHVTGYSVQFQPCLHEFNSLIVAWSPHDHNQWNRKKRTPRRDFFSHFFSSSSLGSNISKNKSANFPRLSGSGDELRIRARERFYQ